MKILWLILHLATLLLLTACQSSELARSDKKGVTLTDLNASLLEQSYRSIQYVIRTDLQFERGCRERNIDINRCDFKNSLHVTFDIFNCTAANLPTKRDSKPNYFVWDLREHGALCSYQATLIWPDGKTDTLVIVNEKYEFGMVYSNELYIEYGWAKKAY